MKFRALCFATITTMALLASACAGGQPLTATPGGTGPSTPCSDAEANTVRQVAEPLMKRYAAAMGQVDNVTRAQLAARLTDLASVRRDLTVSQWPDCAGGVKDRFEALLDSDRAQLQNMANGAESAFDYPAEYVVLDRFNQAYDRVVACHFDRPFGDRPQCGPLDPPAGVAGRGPVIAGLNWYSTASLLTNQGLICAPASIDMGDQARSQECDDGVPNKQGENALISGPDQMRVWSLMLGAPNNAAGRAFLTTIVQQQSYDGASPADAGHWVAACSQGIATLVSADREAPPRVFAYEARRRIGSADVLISGTHPSTNGPATLLVWVKPAEGDLASFTLDPSSAGALPNQTISCDPGSSSASVQSSSGAVSASGSPPDASQPPASTRQFMGTAQLVQQAHLVAPVEMVVSDLQGTLANATLTLREKAGSRSLNMAIGPTAAMAITHVLGTMRLQIDPREAARADIGIDGSPAPLQAVVVNAATIREVRGELIVLADGQVQVVPADPSAGIALAVKLAKPIYVEQQVLSQIGR
jgi:Domain of unknown function (DUF151)